MVMVLQVERQTSVKRCSLCEDGCRRIDKRKEAAGLRLRRRWRLSDCWDLLASKATLWWLVIGMMEVEWRRQYCKRKVSIARKTRTSYNKTPNPLSVESTDTWFQHDLFCLVASLRNNDLFLTLENFQSVSLWTQSLMRISLFFNVREFSFCLCRCCSLPSIKWPQSFLVQNRVATSHWNSMKPE